MNTLPRAVTAQWFKDAEAYLALRRHWRRLIQSDRRRSLNAAHHLLYLALLGKDWRRAFTPPSNPRKLANGAFVGWSFFGALGGVLYGFRTDESLTLFDGLVTPSMLEALRRVLPRAWYAGYRFEQFRADKWPCEAYVITEAAGLAPDAGVRHG